jgi:hypothetical protein
MNSTQKTQTPSALWLLCLPLIALLYFWASTGSKERRDEIISKGKSTIGTLIDTSGDFIECEYTIKGEKYVFSHAIRFTYLRDGERYIVKYLESNPEYIVIIYDSPVYYNDTLYQTVNMENISKRFSDILFSYTVNGKEYKRLKPMNENQLKNPNDYKVKYLIKNPKIGYLIKQNEK